MKTLFLFDQCGEEEPKFFELEGDFSHLNQVYVNSLDKQSEQEELTNILYTEAGHIRQKLFLQPTRDWDFFVLVGFLP